MAQNTDTGLASHATTAVTAPTAAGGQVGVINMPVKDAITTWAWDCSGTSKYTCRIGCPATSCELVLVQRTKINAVVSLFQANVMKFKSRYLQPVVSEVGGKEADSAASAASNGFHVAAAATPPRQDCPTLAYRYPEAFTVDLENGCVRFGFRCLIPGSEGAGTEFLYFDTAGRVSELDWGIVSSAIHASGEGEVGISNIESNNYIPLLSCTPLHICFEGQGRPLSCSSAPWPEGFIALISCKWKRKEGGSCILCGHCTSCTGHSLSQ